MRRSGLGLIAAIIIQVRVGLVPLRRVREALARIREGRARRLEGNFPAEIAPLASELNSLIAHSAEVVGARPHARRQSRAFPEDAADRARQRGLGIAGSARRSGVAPGHVMRRQVDHYLARARAAGALDVLGNRTEVAPVLKRSRRAC